MFDLKSGGNGLQTLPEAALAGLACEAAAQGDVDGVRVLIKAGVNMDVGTVYDHRTPLHLAAAAGDLKMVRFLCEEAKVQLSRDRFGLLAINDAVHNGHTDVRRYLQNINIEWEKEKKDLQKSFRVDLTNHKFDQVMGKVFELVVKEGVFSYNTVFAEVLHFFTDLGLHPSYFEHFTPVQIAKHVHCLIAAKRVAQATNDPSRLDFDITTESHGTFLTSIGASTRTEAQQRTDTKVNKHLEAMWAVPCHISLMFMASEGPLNKGGRENLGIFTTERTAIQTQKVSEDETSIAVLASPKYLKETEPGVKHLIQKLIEDLVQERRAMLRVVPGNTYPGTLSSGWVLFFASPETAGRTYFSDVCQALNLTCMCPRRIYMETFANGVIIYTLTFPASPQESVQKLGRAIMYSTLLKANHKGADVIYNCVMKAKVSFEVGLYLAAGVKFVYTFFPKEDYAPGYTRVHKVLERDPTSQRQLEALYKLCMRDLLSTDRILELLLKYLDLATQIFHDFKEIACGKKSPEINKEITSMIDLACSEAQDRQILKMFLIFNAATLMTNFFKADTPGAFSFRLNPAIVLKGRPKSLYAELPYAIYFISGRDFHGFHVRFRDVSRGGIRIVLSRDDASYERNVATAFDECYNLAFTQQMKNKDIPEGGSKGVILPDAGRGTQSVEFQRSCYAKYINSLLDCMQAEHCQIFSGHMKGSKEILFFGPDENTASLMDLGAILGRQRKYPFWKALTTGKSVIFGGVPHDTYGMTTASVHTYVTEMLQELGQDESQITKFQTGGPDGDLGSNEILVSKDRTICVVDGSGVLYDPAGLNRKDLLRLAKGRMMVKHFNRSMLGKGGFLSLIEDKDVTLPDGSKYATGAQIRDSAHLQPWATADLFVPCGGRPCSVTAETVKNLFTAAGKPKFKYIVEGANLFFTDAARIILEKAGVHLFKDASTNKGGVCSSSCEVLAALALPKEMHTELMTYDPEVTKTPPQFYSTYVTQIQKIIIENAKCEFHAIWQCNQKEGATKLESTIKLSKKINQMSDHLQLHLKCGMKADEKTRLLRCILRRAAPPLLVEQIGLEGIFARVPDNYICAIVSCWVGSRFVYRYGINATEVSFFFFLRDLLATEPEVKRASSKSKPVPPPLDSVNEPNEPAETANKETTRQCQPNDGLFAELAVAPVDPILGTSLAYNADRDPRKINLGIGAYRTEEGKPYVLPIVRAVEVEMLQEVGKTIDKEYTNIDGPPDLKIVTQQLVFGRGEAMISGRIASVQCLSGTGSLRVAAEFIKTHMEPEAHTIWVSNPTWGNHHTIFKRAGLAVNEYPYYKASTRGFDFTGMMTALKSVPRGAVVLLHACAHNPTGVDPTEDQWKAIACIMRQRELVPLVDSAYQGYASGSLEKDAFAVRLFVSMGFEFFLCQSFAKNLGLYGERIGMLHVVCENAPESRAVLSQLKAVIRPMYSSPPVHGGHLVKRALGDPGKLEQWKTELAQMANRILQVRKDLRAGIEAKGTPGNWCHITDQIGMFSFTGLTQVQCERLISTHHIFLLRSGRISLAGLNSRNIQYMVDCVDEVIRACPA